MNKLTALIGLTLGSERENASFNWIWESYFLVVIRWARADVTPDKKFGNFLLQHNFRTKASCNTCRQPRALQHFWSLKRFPRRKTRELNCSQRLLQQVWDSLTVSGVIGFSFNLVVPRNREYYCMKTCLVIHHLMFYRRYVDGILVLVKSPKARWTLAIHHIKYKLHCMFIV